MSPTRLYSSVKRCLIPNRPEFSEEVEELLWSNVIAVGRSARMSHAAWKVAAYLRFFTNKALSMAIVVSKMPDMCRRWPAPEDRDGRDA
jgi:hypothetical protein